MTAIGEAVVIDLQDNQCFGCSQERSDGLAMSFTRTGEKTVECIYKVPEACRFSGLATDAALAFARPAQLTPDTLREPR